MATNTNLGGVFTTDLDKRSSSNVFLSTENVVGIIFDTSIVGGLEKALGGGKAATTFANGNVVELNIAKDVAEAGIDETVMGGLPKYHLDTFFNLVGSTCRIFVSFMDSTTDTEFEAIEQMQLASGGIIYQIGVWTGEAFAVTTTVKEEGEEDVTKVEIPTTSLLNKLENEAELLGGAIGVTNYEGNAPLNILVTAPILAGATIDLKTLPDVSMLEKPKVTVLVGQAATGEVHDIMYAVNHIDTTEKTYAPVGCLGAALACLAIAPANESIAHVESFNLATVMQDAELGFGNIVETEGGTAYSDGTSFTNIKTLGYTKRNNYLHKKGYVFLTNYDGLENSIFFSSDQTLSTGDYRSLARCRVMHKSRRVVRRALLPRVNGDVEIDATTGFLSASAVAEFQNLVIEALDANMVEPGTSKPQISGRVCTIDAEQDVLTNDALDIYYGLIPRGLSAVINVTEGFTNTVG